MNELERTTKYVTATLEVIFHGDYVSADEVPRVLGFWIDQTLNDRDNLRSWTLNITEVDERTGDPEGFDK